MRLRNGEAAGSRASLGLEGESFWLAGAVKGHSISFPSYCQELHNKRE